MSTMATANVGPSFQSCPFQAPNQKWQARFFLLCGVSYSLVHSSASLFLLLHDIVLALFTREAVRRLQSTSICGKMLPDNTVVCDSQGKLILSAWDLLDVTSRHRFCSKFALFFALYSIYYFKILFLVNLKLAYF